MNRLGAALSWSPRRDQLAACDSNGLSLVSAAGKVRRIAKQLCRPVWAPGPSVSS